MSMNYVFMLIKKITYDMYTILYVIKRQLIIAITMISLFSYILLFFIDNELHERRR